MKFNENIQHICHFSDLSEVTRSIFERLENNR